MTHPKRNTMINRTALLLSLFIVHGVAFAAPPSKNNDDIKISTDRGQISLDWDDKEYDWWQNNCLNISTRSSSIKLNCDNMDGKYRDHYNRSIHSGNNPGKGHDKNDWDSNDNAKSPWCQGVVPPRLRLAAIDCLSSSRHRGHHAQPHFPPARPVTEQRRSI